jgi:hypothetical protein
MTSRSIRRLRSRSSLRPTSSSAPAELRLTHRRWSRLMTIYRQWVALDRDTRPPCPVHQPWVQSFDTFLADMGPCPPGGGTIDRLDPSQPYQPGNCCWTSAHLRGRPAKLQLNHQGELRSISEWCRLLQLNYSAVYRRIRRGVSPAVALGLTQECG